MAKIISNKFLVEFVKFIDNFSQINYDYIGMVAKLIDFQTIYNEYFSKIYNYIYYRVLNKEIAEDLTSDLFLKLVNKIDSFDESKANFSTWIYKIASNIVIDYFRAKKQNLSIDDEDNYIKLSVDFEGEKNLIENDERKMLYEALTTLDDRTREFLSMKYFLKFTNREISDMTGVNESTVSTICLRGLKKLKNKMKN